jgi:DNA ligase 1
MCMLPQDINTYLNNETSKPNHIKGDWFISEKYDGIRAIWNGRKLITRNGEEFSFVPEFFTKLLPPNVSLDGELVIPNKQSSYFSNITSKTEFDDKWNGIVYRVFDTPHPKAPFHKRLVFLKKIINKINTQKIQIVQFTPIKQIQQNLINIHNHFINITKNGGKGIILIHKNNIYVPKKTKYLLKYEN